MKPTRSPRSGFSLVELLISMLVMAMLLGAVGMAVQRGSGAFKQGMVAGDLEAKARRMVDRIADEFVGAMSTQMWDDTNAFFVGGSEGSSVDFVRTQGFAAGAVVPGTRDRVFLQLVPSELNDGVDNNGNGLVDECEVILVRDVGGANQTFGWGGFVREFLEGETPNAADDNGNGFTDEPGLHFSLDNNNTLTIRLTLERLDEEGRLVTRSVTTAVQLRN